jgi:hypothetical protein
VNITTHCHKAEDHDLNRIIVYWALFASNDVKNMLLKSGQYVKGLVTRMQEKIII